MFSVIGFGAMIVALVVLLTILMFLIEDMARYQRRKAYLCPYMRVDRYTHGKMTVEIPMCALPDTHYCGHSFRQSFCPYRREKDASS